MRHDRQGCGGATSNALMSNVFMSNVALALDRLVVSEGLEGLSGQVAATFIRSHLGRWLLMEGLTVTFHFALMSFAQISLNHQYQQSQRRYLPLVCLFNKTMPML